MAAWWSEVSHPLLTEDSDAVALIDADTGESIGHGELRSMVERRSADLVGLSGAVVFLSATSTIAFVADYLALTSLGATVALIDPGCADDVLERWTELYVPDAILGFDQGAAPPALNTGRGSGGSNSDALLLATSGSTGNPKFVRLSLDNVTSNARQIATALAIKSDSRAMAHLPLCYSFGLSILNSHLVSGASVVLSPASAIRPEFWDAMRQHRVTSLPGVPYSFEMFRRMKLVEMDLPHLRDVTQAGGRLNPERIREFAAALTARNVRFWIMYGQTEATARISVVPHDQLADALGSVGLPLDGGTFTIQDPDEHGVGEVVYRGPNVMLGYATGRSDLNVGDTMHSVLATGDLGRVDGAGFLWITGRSKRIAKVFGTRVNLDDVERTLESLGHPIAVVASDDGVAVFVESPAPIDGLARTCERLLGFPPRSVRGHHIARLPTTAAGKIDYPQLTTPE